MHIITYEVKASLKTTVIWTVAIVLTFIIFMSGMYTAFLDSREDLTKMLEGYPPQFMAAFGFQLDQIFSYEGFFGFSYIYLGLMAAIMSVALSVGIFGREKKNHCQDFLFAKPVNRSKIFGYKLVAVMLLIVGNNLIFTAITVLIRDTEHTQLSLGRYIIMALSLLFTQLLFMAVGLVIAIFSRKIRTVAGIATSVGFIAFVMTAVLNIIGEEAWMLLAPMRYFDPAYIVEHTFYEGRFVGVALLLFIVVVGVSFYRYCTMDTQSI